MSDNLGLNSHDNNNFNKNLIIVHFLIDFNWMYWKYEIKVWPECLKKAKFLLANNKLLNKLKIFI